MKEIDAKQIFSVEMFSNELEKVSGNLKWRTAPDQAFVLAKAFYEQFGPDPTTPRIFYDTFLNVPIEIEWDFPLNTIQLRDEHSALVKFYNLPNVSL